MASDRTPPIPSNEESVSPLPPGVSAEPVPLELAPNIPSTEAEKRVIEEGWAEHERAGGLTFTTEEIRQLLDEKRRTGRTYTTEELTQLLKDKRLRGG